MTQHGVITFCEGRPRSGWHNTLWLPLCGWRFAMTAERRECN